MGAAGDVQLSGFPQFSGEPGSRLLKVTGKPAHSSEVSGGTGLKFTGEPAYSSEGFW